MSDSCPQCGVPTEQLIAIETGMRLALQATGQAEGLPEQVCPACFQTLSSQVSQGYKLRIERDQRNKNRNLMWKNRVNLVKQARTLMTNKSYSEAAVAYEKYIRLLEVVYNLERGHLSPAVFSNSARSKEMTVIASVYWDLLRIYDTNPGYGDRMRVAAEKLALFLPFSPLYADVVRKAETFSRGAKNPDMVRQFLRASKATRGPCFIATAAFLDEPQARELIVLRRFRDRVLRPHWLGRQFIWAYYRCSPSLAQSLRAQPRVRRLVKPLLRGLSSYLETRLGRRLFL